ncbi:hypothetical protein Dda_1877 [Drechslerella dactyloides]|uniref:Centromere protein H C-terminal domain-containing protein n=1 Tax=Drechslerella dactyloides TaxID=74499 RepID=A0AAD6J4C4_DREDA|nr:hypothetical protein Dda_1877 [Drechslerella dactyloides]
MTAEALHSSCIAIITELMQHRIGFPVLPPSTSTTTEAALRDLTTHQDSDVLASYDRLQDLTLQRLKLEAEVEALQDALANDSMDLDDTTALDIITKQTREVQGKILVRDLVVTQMASTRPIVRAIHSGPNRTKLERYIPHWSPNPFTKVEAFPRNIKPLQVDIMTDQLHHLASELLPLLTTRDLLATTLLHLTGQLSRLQRAHTKASSTLIKHTNSNKDLAERVRQLAAAHEFTESITSNVAVLAKKAEMAKEQRRCETLKGVVQGIIVGSGVNWSEDSTLRRLVLECGDD